MSGSSRSKARFWRRYVEAIKGDYANPDRLLCVIGIHKDITSTAEPRWWMDECVRCGRLKHRAE